MPSKEIGRVIDATYVVSLMLKETTVDPPPEPNRDAQEGTRANHPPMPNTPLAHTPTLLNLAFLHVVHDGGRVELGPVVLRGAVVHCPSADEAAAELCQGPPARERRQMVGRMRDMLGKNMAANLSNKA